MAETRSFMLDDALAELRATRERTLALAGGLTQSEFDRPPARGGWSVGEVLDHVLLAERLNREQLARLIRLKRSGLSPELNLTFSDVNVSVAHLPRSLLPLLQWPLAIMNTFVPDCLRSYMTRNRLVPFQNPDQATPRRGRAAPQLREDLVVSLEETEGLLRANPDLDYGEMVIRHPLLGSYDAPGLLRFMSAHEQRHQSQVADLLSRPRSRRRTSA